MSGRARRSDAPAARDDERGDLQPPPIDPDALLVALVLVPHSYPRNRFFALFKRPEAKAIRRRAAHLRSLVAGLLGDASAIEVVREPDGRVALGYRLRGLGARRVAMLTEAELALVELAARHVDPALQLDAHEDARRQVMSSLERLFVLD